MTDPQALLTLDQAAKLIPGADANTLKRMARAGKLTVYKPGKAHLTTLADVMEAVTQQCRVAPKVRTGGCIPPDTTTLESSPMSQLGLSSTEVADAAADLEVMRLINKKKKR